MRCHVCNVAVGDGQRFCHECGESLDGVTNRTEPHDVLATEAEADAVTAEHSRVVVSSETVDAPTDPEPPSIHPDPLPGLAGIALTDDIDLDDASWWADGPGEVDLASTEALATISEAADQPLEPSDRFDTPRTGASTALSTMAFEEIDDVVEPAPVADEATTTMPAMGAAAPGALPTTDELPEQAAAVFDGAGDVDGYAAPPSEGFKLRAAFIFSVLTMVATLMASVADIIDIRTSRPVDGIVVGIRVMDDFGTNLAVAGFIGAAIMLVGGLLSCFGLRSGAGLAGGAGLGMAGWAAMTIGLIEAPIYAAQQITRASSTDVTQFTLSTTRDLGWFLIAAVGALGILVFAVSLRMAGAGGRRGLNPWVAALGALGAVIVAAGPLFPVGDATADLNLGFSALPRAFFAGRLVQVSLIAVTGVIGYLSVRTYGLGLAAGGLGVGIWLWATSLGEVGDKPIGIAVGNIGTIETTPHGVTSAGVVVSIVMITVATTMAILTRPRA
jgi:hypothetical protein